MPRSKSQRRESTRSSAQTELTEDGTTDFGGSETKSKRTISVYDAVAGKVGVNGFMTQEQLMSANILPSPPEEVLLRRINAPDEIPFHFYNTDERLETDQKLPDSDLLKAIHSYSSDFFAATTVEKGQKDFRALDGTALLALGVLLEEASRVALGETGDMALVEPENLERGLPESKMTKHQVVGRVKPRQVQRQEPQSQESDELEQEQSPRKRRRAGT